MQRRKEKRISGREKSVGKVLVVVECTVRVRHEKLRGHGAQV